MNLLDFLNTHSKICCNYLRVVFVFVLFTALLSFFSGCSTHKKPTPQPGEFEYKKTGMASYYAKKFQSRKTASGEIFDNNLMTAAHRSLPFGTNVVVKNLNNGKSVKVKINDRGPYIKRRIIDLSRAAFAKIENMNKGVTKVEIMVVD
jgi:rare lipoprotein A (peptidoglycan hydrolase)